MNCTSGPWSLSVRTELRFSYAKTLPLAIAILLQFASATLAQSPNALLPGPKPADVPLEWKELVGIYADEPKSIQPLVDSKRSFVLLESDGKLFWRDNKGKSKPISVRDGIIFPPSEAEIVIGHTISRDEAGNVNGFCYLNFCFTRTDPGSDQAHAFRIKPLRPVNRLRTEALAAKPPAETGPFRKPSLVELSTLNAAIHLDIRYATSNNFLSTPVYTEARAFLQLPTATALRSVLEKLVPLGYGLLIHDAYRPWYVTKIFWDATPREGRIFVADPQKGSKHNRGCAVDLTLYDLSTGQPVEMPGLYDEMSPRSFPNFPGGTSLQRWHRDLLRRAMESEGFTVNEDEWWHFDYKDWTKYAILNIPFEKIALPKPISDKHAEQ